MTNGRQLNLVFIHGAGFTAEVFERQRGAFADAHFLNLPGHCSVGSAASMGQFVEFLEDYVERNRLGDVVLCGHSMGGAIAIEAALQGRIPVRALVLLGSGAKLRVAPTILDSLEADFDRATADIAQYFFADPTPERVTWVTNIMRSVGQRQTVSDFRICDAFDVLERLDELSMPLLALTGEADRMTPPKFATALAGRVRNGEARIIAGAGHFEMVERPEETNAQIRAFLTGMS